MLAFLLSQRAQIRQERRQARLTRVNAQLRELYGPLNTLVDTNEQVWGALRATVIPAKEEREAGAGTSEWLRWRDQVLMPTNRRMRDLIIEHADLIIEADVPQPLRDFCAHVLSLEVAITEEVEGVSRPTLISHPGSNFTNYVRHSFAHLKRQQRQLLGSSS